MAAERVRQLLDEQGISYDAETHPRAVSAQRLAQAEHITGWMIAKPVILQAGDDLVMAVIPGAAMVDLDRAATALGTDVRLATEERFTSVFPDCEDGAEPPFGSLYGIPVFVDPILERDEFIVFRAGTHDTTMRMRTTDYLDVEHPTMAELAVHPAIA